MSVSELQDVVGELDESLLEAFQAFNSAKVKPQWFEESLMQFAANVVFHIGVLAFVMVKKVGPIP